VIIACKSYRTKNPQNTEILRAVSLNQGRRSKPSTIKDRTLSSLERCSISS